MMASRTHCLAILAASLGLLNLVVGFWLPESSAQVRTVPAPAPPQLPKDKADKAAKEKGLQGFTDAISLKTDREASRRIEAIKQYIAKENPPWETILEVAQRLLEMEQDSLLELTYTDETGNERTSMVSIRAEMTRMLGELPAEGREFYQQLYGPPAQALLDEALNNRDVAKLNEVSRRYLHTKAGGRATRLLAGYFLDRGFYQQAASCYERLFSRADAKELDGRTIFQAALAFRRLGDTQRAEKFWTQLQSKLGDEPLVLANRPFTPAQLRTELERDREQLRRVESGWAMYRGGATRNGFGEGSVPFLKPRYTSSMFPIMPYEEENSYQDPRPGMDWIQQYLDAIDELEDAAQPALPGFFPIAAGDKIIFRDYRGVQARFTNEDLTEDPPLEAGELAWASWARNGLFAMVHDNRGRNLMENRWWTDKNNLNNTAVYFPRVGPQRIFSENGLLGTLSHDGKRVYYVDDLAVPPHPNKLLQLRNNRARRARSNVQPFEIFEDAVASNQLVALELASGKQIWRIGEPEGDTPVNPDESITTFNAFRSCLFLGAPLPLNGKLYVVLERNQELSLACLDPEDLVVHPDRAPERMPKLLWMQPLGEPITPMPEDTIRRIQGIHLAYSDGILVIPTNCGAVVGVELLTESLLWAHSYGESTASAGRTDPARPAVAVGRGRRIVVPPRGVQAASRNLNEDRWRSGAPVIVEGKVVFTAYDSPYLQCLELRTGKLLWSVPRAEQDLYLAGVYDGKVVVVGSGSVRALSLADGRKVVWKQATGLPAGHGVATADRYYLPLKSTPSSDRSELWVLDLTSGKVLSKATSRKDRPLGNLLFHNGDVFSQTDRELVAYPQLQRKLEEMNRRLAANPTDPMGLTERGELRLDDGKLQAAIEDFRVAIEQEPNEPIRLRARERLYEALTELLYQDFGAGEPYLAEYRRLCEISIPADADPVTKQTRLQEQRARQATRLSLLAQGRERQGRLVEAFEHYLAYGSLQGNAELIRPLDDTQTLARPDVWARGRIRRMLQKATEQERAPLEAKIAEEWRRVRAAGDLARLREFVQVFGSLVEIGKEARLELAERLIAQADAETWRDAEILLQGLRAERGQDLITARATETLARLLSRKAAASGTAALYQDAVALYLDLGRDFPTITIRDGKTGRDFLTDLLTDKRYLPYLEPVRQLWPQVLKAEKISGAQARRTQPSFTVEPKGADIPFYDQYRLVMDLNAQGRSSWQLRLVERSSNQTVWQQPGLPAFTLLSNPRYRTQNFQFAHAHGHLLLLNLNHLVFAFDVVSGKKLWEYNLFGVRPMPNPQPQPEIKDKQLRLVYEGGWTQVIGQVGVLQASYVCLQTRDGLVTLHPTRGEVLWKRTDVAARLELFGDAERVYLVEQDAGGTPTAVRAVRAADGMSVEVPDCLNFFTHDSSIADGKKVRARDGGRLLVLDTSSDVHRLRYYDIPTGQDVWVRELPPQTLMISSDQEHLAGMITPNGKIHLFNARTGGEIFTSRLDAKHIAEHLRNVRSAHLLVDSERYYVCLNTKPEEGVSYTPCLTSGLRSVLVNGRIYCFDQATGKRLWFTDEQFDSQAIVLEQFRDLPVIMGAAQYTRFDNGRLQRQGTEVVALDKRNGKAIFRGDIENQGPFYALKAVVDQDLIELIRHDLRIRFSRGNRDKRSAATALSP